MMQKNRSKSEKGGGKSIVFTFGRLQPPTIGHERLVQTLIKEAKSLGADHCVYISQTRNNTKDPLDWTFKIRVCESAFPGVKISKDKSIKTPFQALESISMTYNKVVLVVGSDQAPEFAQRMAPYAEKMGLDFRIVSAGQRVDESDGVEGISATKMRKYALENMREEFYRGLPSNLKDSAKKLIYENTKKGLKKIVK